MSPHPLRLLIVAYAATLIGGLAVQWAGYGAALALAVFWLGGPLAVVALGGTPLVNRPFVHRPRVAPATDAADAPWAAWDDDLAEDRAEAGRDDGAKGAAQGGERRSA